MHKKLTPLILVLIRPALVGGGDFRISGSKAKAEAEADVDAIRSPHKLGRYLSVPTYVVSKQHQTSPALLPYD